MVKISKEKRGASFRIAEDVLDSLNNEAESNMVSLNTLVSQIFVNHVRWHSKASQAGYVVVMRSTIEKLLERISENEVAEIAASVAEDQAKDATFLLSEEYDVDSTLDLLEHWIGISGYPYTRKKKDDVETFVIQHDMGKKWSMYIVELYQKIFDDLKLRPADFDITNNTVVLTIYKKPLA